MEYKDKRTLVIMSGLNKPQNDDYYSKKNQRDREKHKKKLVTNFYLRNIAIMDRVWWSLLSENEREDVHTIWTQYIDKESTSKEDFFIDMKKRFDKTQQIRDRKLESLL